MRLRDVKDTLDIYLPILDLPVENQPLANGHAGAVIRREAGQLRNALRQMATVPPLAGAAQRALANEVLHEATPTEQPAGPAQVISLLAGQVRGVVEPGLLLQRTLDGLVPDEEPLELAIKLPLELTLGDLVKVVGDIELVFDHPARVVTGDGVRFKGFDRGSEWIVIVAGTTLVFKYTMSLIRACMKVLDRQRKIEQTELLLTELAGFSQEIKATTQAGLKKLAREWSREAILEATDEEPSPEKIGATLIAIERLAALYNRQMEVRLALAAPKEETADFPKAEEVAKLLTPQFGAPLLTAGDESSGATGDDSNK